MIDGELRIEYFVSYDRNKYVSRLILAYNQAIGKDAECAKMAIDEAFGDLGEFMDLWQGEFKKELVNAFGAENLDFTPVNHRINGFHHDRHIVKCSISFFLVCYFIFF